MEDRQSKEKAEQLSGEKRHHERERKKSSSAMDSNTDNTGLQCFLGLCLDLSPGQNVSHLTI